MANRATSAAIYAPVGTEDFHPITGEVLEASDSQQRRFELLALMRRLDPRRAAFITYDRPYYVGKRDAHWPYMLPHDKRLVERAEADLAQVFKAMAVFAEEPVVKGRWSTE